MQKTFKISKKFNLDEVVPGPCSRQVLRGSEEKMCGQSYISI